MTRQEFLRRLRAGLVGLPTTTANEIAADYETHFDDGIAAGRSEAEVAAALGDPDRLARELRAAAVAQRWHQEKNPSAAVAAIFAVLGLGAISILFLLPILMSVVGVLFGLFMAAIGVFIAGGAIMVAGPFAGFPGGPAAAILAGLGLMAGSTTLAALTAVLTIWLINGVVWFARLHYRLLKPALNTPTQDAAQES
ncbi:DUF1700 domain-containing protein [Brevundimonas sp.]|uniref:DUF1700 domain-containing protein n=1 Tax=Brevundimonas sp. TaxID=1871086 RepID=UPI002619815D|nr:DUF1700 domain-containing protein [Brevundimonas sp.]